MLSSHLCPALRHWGVQTQASPPPHAGLAAAEHASHCTVTVAQSLLHETRESQLWLFFSIAWRALNTQKRGSLRPTRLDLFRSAGPGISMKMKLLPGDWNVQLVCQLPDENCPMSFIFVLCVFVNVAY